MITFSSYIMLRNALYHHQGETIFCAWRKKREPSATRFALIGSMHSRTTIRSLLVRQMDYERLSSVSIETFSLILLIKESSIFFPLRFLLSGIHIDCTPRRIHYQAPQLRPSLFSLSLQGEAFNHQSVPSFSLRSSPGRATASTTKPMYMHYFEPPFFQDQEWRSIHPSFRPGR